MEDIFSINSKFYHFLSKTADCMILSMLWLVSSFPLFTLGASTTALYYCVIKVVREEQSKPFQTFCRAFRDNFKQSTIVSLITLAVTVLATLAGSAAYAANPIRETLDTVYTVYLVLLAIGIAWLHYIISYIARFQASLKTILKNSLVICIANLPSSISMMVLFVVGVVVLILTMPASAMFLLLAPAAYAYVTSFLLERIYRKYMPAEESEEQPL